MAKERHKREERGRDNNEDSKQKEGEIKRVGKREKKEETE